jgi:hypothetical protein
MKPTPKDNIVYLMTRDDIVFHKLVINQLFRMKNNIEFSSILAYLVYWLQHLKNTTIINFADTYSSMITDW